MWQVLQSLDAYGPNIGRFLIDTDGSTTSGHPLDASYHRPVSIYYRFIPDEDLHASPETLHSFAEDSTSRVILLLTLYLSEVP